MKPRKPKKPPLNFNNLDDREHRIKDVNAAGIKNAEEKFKIIDFLNDFFLPFSRWVNVRWAINLGKTDPDDKGDIFVSTDYQSDHITFVSETEEVIQKELKHIFKQIKFTDKEIEDGKLIDKFLIGFVGLMKDEFPGVPNSNLHRYSIKDPDVLKLLTIFTKLNTDPEFKITSESSYGVDQLMKQRFKGGFPQLQKYTKDFIFPDKNEIIILINKIAEKGEQKKVSEQKIESKPGL